MKVSESGQPDTPRAATIESMRLQGVVTTGIYCRADCRARPKPENVLQNPSGMIPSEVRGRYPLRAHAGHVSRVRALEAPAPARSPLFWTPSESVTREDSHLGRSLFYIVTSVLCSLGANDVRSVADYPEDWRNWPKVKETFIPSADTPLPENIPPLYVETIKMYNWINGGKGTRLDIYVNPKVLEQYRTHGPYPDGVTSVGVYADAEIVFVTQHLLGEAVYGTYDTKGRDIAARHPTFAPTVCVRCHSGYAELCQGGTCAVPDPKKATH